MASKGGAREGAGRPAGVPNKANIQIKELLDKVVDYEKLLGKLVELSNGVEVQKLNSSGEYVVYQEKPDTHASKILLEYRYGKPTQSMDVTTLGQPITGIQVEIIEHKGE